MSTNINRQLLAEMAGLVREEKKVKQLTVDHCIPHLAKVYKMMSTVGDRTREVGISEIISNLDNATVSYECECKHNLSCEIVALLKNVNIPANLLFKTDPQTGNETAVGVVLKLYR